MQSPCLRHGRPPGSGQPNGNIWSGVCYPGVNQGSVEQVVFYGGGGNLATKEAKKAQFPQQKRPLYLACAGVGGPHSPCPVRGTHSSFWDKTSKIRILLGFGGFPSFLLENGVVSGAKRAGSPLCDRRYFEAEIRREKK